jgi:hypothetical protein
MLFTMDGNDSLKQIIQQGPPEEGAEEQPGPVIEHPDPHLVISDYYIPREEVDKWADYNAQEMTSVKDQNVCTSYLVCSSSVLIDQDV